MTPPQHAKYHLLSRAAVHIARSKAWKTERKLGLTNMDLRISKLKNRICTPITPSPSNPGAKLFVWLVRLRQFCQPSIGPVRLHCVLPQPGYTGMGSEEEG